MAEGTGEGQLALRDRELKARGLLVAEGRLLVERAVRSGFDVEGIWCDGAAESEARSLAGERIPLAVCGPEELDLAAGFHFHRGMLALVRRPSLRTLPETGTGAPSGLLCGPWLALPAITDPGNLGTLLRSALAFGFSAVLLGGQSCDPFNRKALRASMGASFSLPLYGGGPEFLSVLAAEGRTVYAAAMEPDALVAGPDEPLSAAGAHSSGPVLVLGNEYSGIPGD